MGRRWDIYGNRERGREREHNGESERMGSGKEGKGIWEERGGSERE